MDSITLYVLALGLSMDAFAVSISNSMCFSGLRRNEAALTSLSFGVFQGLMPVAGYFAGRAFADVVSAFDHWIAFALLGFIGGKMILEAVRGGEEGSGGMAALSHKRLLALAVATSIDALAVGVSFAFSPPDPGVVLSCAVIGCTTFLIAFGGAMAASRIPGIRPKPAEIAGGINLVGIGVKLLLEGLLKYLYPLLPFW